uniref:Uncharacterized protein n=1 Tax=Glossina pallidipes TaxID=7398 RepID=A0A1A9Z396_GLOPL
MQRNNIISSNLVFKRLEKEPNYFKIFFLIALLSLCIPFAIPIDVHNDVISYVLFIIASPEKKVMYANPSFTTISKLNCCCPSRPADYSLRLDHSEYLDLAVVKLVVAD